LAVIAAVSCLFSCTEQIDESARYVFKYPTAWGYLQKLPETYSTYNELLKIVPVSDKTNTTVSQLLSARGHYTVFAPTNEAIENYLDTLVTEGIIDRPSWDAFTDSLKLDSIRKVIVYNSILDCGDNSEAYITCEFPVRENEEFGYPAMNESRLTVNYNTEDPDEIRINRWFPINKRNRDIMVTNGAIHQMEAVIRSNDITLAYILSRHLEGADKGFMVMAKLVDACGLMDTLDATRDEAYEKFYARTVIPRSYGGTLPAHRKYGFTIFAEPDESWEQTLGKPATEITPADVQAWVVEKNFYPDALDNEAYTTEKNVLYQWTTYHILGQKMPVNKLVFHTNEVGYAYKTNPYEYGIPVMDYYVPMGPRRLLKTYESRESKGVYLNRFPKLDNGRKGTNHELYCEPGKEGVRVYKEDPTLLSHSGSNGFIYAIDSPLAYTKDVQENLGKSRLRVDVACLCPELLNNDMRDEHRTGDEYTYFYMPNDAEYRYLDNISVNEGTHFNYTNGYGIGYWVHMQGDVFSGTGYYDVTVKLPPVPVRDTYEIRYRMLTGYNYGISQIYLGEDPQHMYAADIPVDLHWYTWEETARAYGQFQDTGDEEADAQSDKDMRNQKWMKAEASTLDLGCQGEVKMRRQCNVVRFIASRQVMDPDKQYYFKIRSVLDKQTELYLDFLEFCPKSVYDNPSEPEDVW